MAVESPSRSTAAEFGELARFTFDGARNLPWALRYGSEILRQTAYQVRSSWFLLASMAFLMGMAETNYGYYFLKAAGASDFTGLVSGFADPRATGPFIFGYAFAAKVGCGLASEIGAMRIAEEIDAVEAQAVDAMRYIVGTRVLAAALFAPIAAGVVIVAIQFGAYTNSIHFLQALPESSFFQYHWGMQAVVDHLYAVAVMSITAMTIAAVACFYGYRASGGPAGVGTVVARSLVINLVLVHMITGVAVALIYADPQLPIGG